ITMKYEDYKNQLDSFESSGVLDTASKRFHQSITNKINQLEDDALYDNEFLAELMTFTFREAFKTAYKASLTSNLDENELHRALEENEKAIKDAQKKTLSVVRVTD
ncbi:hypothetical protein ACWE42_25320, partial [Sutcliffiella cohnii]